MEIKGTIKLIGETQTFSNDFKKRQLVVTTAEQYPQHIAIDFLKEKTEALNNYKVGQEVTVGINLGGREWVNPQGEVKYFNSITGWKISSSGATEKKYTGKTEDVLAEVNAENEKDDLPF